MKKIHFYLCLLWGLLSILSCSEDTDVPAKQGTPLSLSVTTTRLQSKALIEAATLPDKSTLGLMLVDGGGLTYDKTTYHNVLATASGSGSSQSWGLDRDLLLSATTGCLYAYHPYSPDVTDLTRVSVSAGETDYMYATPVTGLSDGNAAAQLTMNHALAAIRVNVVRGSYGGGGQVSAVTVCADNVASSAALDATAGSLSDIGGAGEVLSRSVDFMLSEVSEKVDFVVVPVMGQSAAATFGIVVDGVAYTIPAEVMTYAQGSLYTYTLTVNSAGVALSDVTVGDWGYNSSGEPVIRVNGKTVTLTGNTEGIAFNNVVGPDGTVTIQAYTIVPQKQVEEVYLSGSSTLRQSLDEFSGIRTITLSGITEDEQVHFQGVWYPVYIEGDMAGMTFSRRRAADGSLTVTATPVDADDAVKEASGSGDGVLSQSFDESTNVRTLTVSAQNSPYTINMNGISTTWLVATYNITSTGSAQILNSLFDVSNLSAMRVDGVSTPLSETYNFTSTGLHIVKYKLADNTIIPANIMYGVTLLQSISIPACVQTIGVNAFRECSGLTGELVIPNSVTSIGNGAFIQCSKLSGVLKIPDSVTTVGEWAFEECTGFTGIDLGMGLLSIGQFAFYNCTGLTGELRIPDTVTSIGYRAFHRCYKINSVTLGGGLQTLGSQSFISCTGLSGELRIPDSMVSIGSAAFSGCTGLTSLDLGTGVQSIGESAFDDCTGLTGELVIPNSVTDIGDNAFEECAGFTSLVLGAGLQTIGNYVFRNCTSLSGSLLIPDKVTVIGNYAFYGCKGLTGELVIPNSVTTIGQYAFYNNRGFTGALIIPNSVTEIGQEAFNGCEGFTSLKLGSGVKSIGDGAFSSCSKLSGALRIPDGVENIGSETFWGCSGLTSLDFGAGVQSIGQSSFQACTGLTGELIIPNNVKTLGYRAFAGCEKLTSLKITEGLTDIGGNAFRNCTGLISVELGSSLQTIGSQAFYLCSKLSQITSLALTAPIIQNDTFGVKSDGVLIIPPGTTGYDIWMQTSSYYLGYYNWTLQVTFTATDCLSLSITADNVSGNRSFTRIHYTAVCNGIDNLTGAIINNVTINGTVDSDDFGQNPSTTDSRQVTLSYTYMGITATTTITQSPYVASYYIVDLNNQWQASSKANPDNSLYDGVYESFSNYHVSNSGAVMTIKIFGHNTFTIYIRSYAESNYDYVMASALDQNITYSTSYSDTSLVRAHTRGAQNSGTDIGSYKAITYDIPDDGQEHTITVVYRKDNSSDKDDDKGYLLIAKP